MAISPVVGLSRLHWHRLLESGSIDPAHRLASINCAAGNGKPPSASADRPAAMVRAKRAGAGPNVGNARAIGSCKAQGPCATATVGQQP